MELPERENPFELQGRLPEALVLGMYPALFSLPNRRDRVEHMRELSDAYLYRDVLQLGDIRNILIEDTKEWHLRGDQGALWENFLVSERMKTNAYSHRHCNSFFWRVYTGAEIDYVEEGDGEIRAYEFKLRKKRATAPRSFMQAYPGAQFHSIHMDNRREFIPG